MSGGSYNYLCYQTDDLTRHRSDLQQMAERLGGLDWATGAAAATRNVIRLLDQAEAAAEKLGDVWKAVEWWDSADWGEDQVREAVAAYQHGEGE